MQEELSEAERSAVTRSAERAAAQHDQTHRARGRLRSDHDFVHAGRSAHALLLKPPLHPGVVVSIDGERDSFLAKVGYECGGCRESRFQVVCKCVSQQQLA